MVREKGLSGIIGLHTARFPVNGWEISHKTHGVVVYCERQDFKGRYHLEDDDLSKVIGHDWQVRCDNEEHIYQGIAKCTGISHPISAPRRGSVENFRNNFALHFDFLHGCYGPFHVVEGIAMGRNGNCMFFDLISLTEMDANIAGGDVRFIFKTPFKA
jgi:hypothetical protein